VCLVTSTIWVDWPPAKMGRDSTTIRWRYDPARPSRHGNRVASEMFISRSCRSACGPNRVWVDQGPRRERCHRRASNPPTIDERRLSRTGAKKQLCWIDDPGFPRTAQISKTIEHRFVSAKRLEEFWNEAHPDDDNSRSTPAGLDLQSSRRVTICLVRRRWSDR